MTSSIRSLARLRWPGAESIAGDGEYALVLSCGLLRVSLWRTFEQAKAAQALADRFGCGEDCDGRHQVTEIETRKVS